MKPLFKLRKTEKYGRGVYANRNIRKGEVIERSPCIIFTKDEHHHFSDTLINFYVFGWPNGGAAETALALGVGSLFNHDSKPNVTYTADMKTQQMVFKACSPVKKGEQLFINYGYDPKEVRSRWEIKKLRDKKEDDKKEEVKYLGLEASLKEAEIRRGQKLIEKIKVSLPPYGVIKNDKFEFWDEDKAPVLPKAPLINLSMSKADAELTVVFLILAFLTGVFQGFMTAQGIL